MSKEFEEWKAKLRQLPPEEWDSFSTEELTKIRDTLKEGRLPSERSIPQDIAAGIKEDVSEIGAFTESALQSFTKFGLAIGERLGSENPEWLSSTVKRRDREIATKYPGNELAKKAGALTGQAVGLAGSLGGVPGAIGGTVLKGGGAVLGQLGRLVTNPLTKKAASFAGKSATYGTTGAAANEAYNMARQKFK